MSKTNINLKEISQFIIKKFQRKKNQTQLKVILAENIFFYLRKNLQNFQF
jgi:hypothetical protein